MTRIEAFKKAKQYNTSPHNISGVAKVKKTVYGTYRVEYEPAELTIIKSLILSDTYFTGGFARGYRRKYAKSLSYYSPRTRERRFESESSRTWRNHRKN